MNRIKDPLKKRNGLTVRWPDSVHKAICELAWTNRQTVSSMIRDVMVAYLKRNGVHIDECGL